MGVKLTEDVVKATPHPVRGNKIHYDDAVAGFGLRVTAGGSKAFVLNYTFRGRERRATIGGWPAWGVKAAREEARRMRRAIDVGEDPMSERDLDRAAPTVAELARRYMAEHASGLRPKTAAEYESMFRLYVLPALGTHRVPALTTKDIRRLYDKTRAKFPTRANRLVSLIAAMLKWGGSPHHENPASEIYLPPEEGRERFLTNEEVDRLCTAIDDLHDQRSADALRLLLATGARKMEVLGATWKEFNLSNATWTKPAQRMKAKRRHSVPLAATAVELLRILHGEAKEQERAGPDDFILPGAGAPGHLGDVKRAWRRVTEAAGLGHHEEPGGGKGRGRPKWIPDARVHDLRHTFASQVVTQTGSLPIVGRLLGQSRLASAQRYAHLADPALRSAADNAGKITFKRRNSGR